MSVTFRDMANNKINKHQWIVLDGDIDAEWIESMNTVMDDNKMLTLASNERIPLTPSMRLLLEINHMNHCSPATVSRGGVIYVNAEDVGWKPVVDSWIEKLEATEYRPLLTTLFTRYVDPTLEYCRRNFKYVVPLPAVSQTMTVCKILEGILPKVRRARFPLPPRGPGPGRAHAVGRLPLLLAGVTVPPRSEQRAPAAGSLSWCPSLSGAAPCPAGTLTNTQESVRGAPPPDKKLLEYHFVFACVWAFGGCMLVDKVSDYRQQFSKWWISEWKNVQFPEKGLVYDYYVDEAQCLMVPWEDKVRGGGAHVHACAATHPPGATADGSRPCSSHAVHMRAGAQVPVLPWRLWLHFCADGRDDAPDVLPRLAHQQQAPRDVCGQHGHGQDGHHDQQAQEHGRRDHGLLHDQHELVQRRALAPEHPRAAPGEEER